MRRTPTITPKSSSTWVLLLLLCWSALSACTTPTEGTTDSEGVEDATPVVVRAFVERADVTPGRPFLLTVEVDRREDVVFDLPDLGAHIEGLVIMDQEVLAPEKLGRRELLKTTYKLKAPLAGTYLIPAVEAPWKTDDNEVGTAGTGAILIEAARLAGEDGAGEDTLRDLKPLAEPDSEVSAALLPLAAAAVALLVFLFVMERRAKRRRKKETPALPPHEQALRDLGRLGRLDLTDPSNHPHVAYEVSAILRRYLEGRFGFSAWKMTTEEVLQSMPAELAAHRSVPAAVGEVLQASDLVKFAGQEVDGPVLSGWIDRARSVVDITTSVSEEEDAA